MCSDEPASTVTLQRPTKTLKIQKPRSISYILFAKKKSLPSSNMGPVIIFLLNIFIISISDCAKKRELFVQASECQTPVSPVHVSNFRRLVQPLVVVLVETGGKQSQLLAPRLKSGLYCSTHTVVLFARSYQIGDYYCTRKVETKTQL